MMMLEFSPLCIHPNLDQTRHHRVREQINYSVFMLFYVVETMSYIKSVSYDDESIHVVGAYFFELYSSSGSAAILYSFCSISIVDELGFFAASRTIGV